MITNANSNGTAGIQVIFDIDHGFEFGDSIFWASLIRLYNADGDLIGQGKGGSLTTDGAGGSTSSFDDYLAATLTAAGTYYIEVINARPFGGLPQGVDYQLQVSIENHRIDGLLFAPSTVLEDEEHNNSAPAPAPRTSAATTTSSPSSIPKSATPAATHCPKIASIPSRPT